LRPSWTQILLLSFSLTKATPLGFLDKFWKNVHKHDKYYTWMEYVHNTGFDDGSTHQYWFANPLENPSPSPLPCILLHNKTYSFWFFSVNESSNLFPISLRVQLSQKSKGRWGNLTHIGDAMIYSSGLKSRDLSARYIPLDPIKYCSRKNIEWYSSLLRKSKAK